MAKLFEGAGKGLILLGGGLDTIQLSSGKMSGPKYLENRVVDLIAWKGGWLGAAFGAGYFGLEHWYRGGAEQPGGGANGFVRDLNSAEAREIGRCHCDPDLPSWER